MDVSAAVLIVELFNIVISGKDNCRSQLQVPLECHCPLPIAHSKHLVTNHDSGVRRR